MCPVYTFPNLKLQGRRKNNYSEMWWERKFGNWCCTRCCWCPGKSEKRSVLQAATRNVKLHHDVGRSRHSPHAPCTEERHQLLRNFHVLHGNNIPFPSMWTVFLASVPCQAAILEWQNAGDIELSQKSFFFLLLALRVKFLYLSVPCYCWVFPFGLDRTRISSKTQRRNQYFWPFLAFKQSRTCFREIDLQRGSWM